MRKPFQNEVCLDFSVPEVAERFRKALVDVRSQFGKEYPLIIGGKEIYTEDKIASLNPSKYDEVVGYVSKAKPEHIDQAIACADEAFKSWKKFSMEARAACLYRAAAIMRARRYELAAWVAYECGRNWGGADYDIAFTIDHLEYYGYMAEQLNEDKRLMFTGFNEQNKMVYIPLGTGVTISPSNFPIALMAGMVSAAVVTGNCVLVKPSSLTPVVCYLFCEICREAGIPDGVINFVPGGGGDIGDYIVENPNTRFIVFTGSKDVGLHINELAAKVTPETKWIKRVILEMGGKDAIMVDDQIDDLDKCADSIIMGAFDYQGQKCAACSRVIIHEKNYDALAEKLVERAKKLTIGPVEGGFDQGPIVGNEGYEKVLKYIEIGKQEGTLLCGGNKGPEGGYFIEPTIIGDIKPTDRLAQEEVFGPVLALIKVKSYEEGVEVFNGTQYGLTGAFFSSNRDHLERAKDDLYSGIVNLNNDCTHSNVSASPFGGFNLSGTDSKTGSADYLQLFVQAKTITEAFE